MFRDWIEAARPKTLPAAVVPILVGTAEAKRMGFFDWWPVLICLVFALLVQIATNMANDYYDHVRGADTQERVGPERLVASGRIEPIKMLRASLVVFLLAFLIGLNLVAYRDWSLLVVGVVSIIFGYGYTGGPFPLAYRGLGDVFVIFFFGLVATMGTVYVIVGTLTVESAYLGIMLGLLANNILVVNNYRDRDTDLKAGKLTLIARWGRNFGLAQYRLQLMVAFLSLGLYVAATENAWHSLPFLAFPVGLKLASVLEKTEGPALNGVLAKTAAFLLLVGVLLGGAVFVSVAVSSSFRP
ncbi:1,4-dihydroxy-2-naphthoate polyprenyltransferase [Pelagicoccus sp. SDUM812002]|uniref:1,4-dihydroxy-2-naphthoate polyprenyltransferase n=1 Tax=Pelagicoccus sp. SDUM812002 TaxID=3041266 RepID=UPI00281027A6|nr:1,4-dihydroxy-2-naphthoate polyprenyltransferase [Pelagicoccus sp. SDUM812002]MDQ8187918.1 1,4-dihydroxy-2-naphthoate polyprenyltransferase [Pelagicoccus sp. SDUM812002]